MKKGRYFKDEFQCLFIDYVVVPAVLFTLICSLCFLAVTQYAAQVGNGTGACAPGRERNVFLLGSVLIVAAFILMTIWVLISAKRVMEKKNEDFRLTVDTYNETIDNLKRQMENNGRMAELVAISQLKQLESQFNPHFLFNTLENIRYMCRIDSAVAEKMLLSLSGLLRYSLDGNKAEVTLKEDLTHLENYLLILKYRFNRRFSYRIEISEEVLKCRIPRLILQPMIENSVKYGFGSQENLSVELKAYIHDERLIMICRDDGAGITPGILREITELLSEEENKSRHSGLYNIHRRIKILYGHPFGVEIRSTEGYGTTLIVTLPVRWEEMKCCE